MSNVYHFLWLKKEIEILRLNHHVYKQKSNTFNEMYAEFYSLFGNHNSSP